MITTNQNALHDMNYPLLLPSDPEERRSLIHTSQLGEPDARRRLLASLFIRRRCGLVTLMAIFGSFFVVGIVEVWDVQSSGSRSYNQMIPQTVTTAHNMHEEGAKCLYHPCFNKANIHVPMNKPGFPSFLSFANKGPIDVSYDSRSLQLNGERTFFLGGSMHPSRATHQTWNLALDEAVQNGLNLITIYVMWVDHQPFPDRDIDWRLEQSISCDTMDDPSGQCEWSLATAIRSAADRGLFVHLRIGPYTCAEYSYGGIPPWLPLRKPDMKLRRPNREWLEAMESWVAQTVEYIRSNRLWAYQGGNILLAQIENELAGNDNKAYDGILQPDVDDNLLFVDTLTGEFIDIDEVYDRTVRKASIQDYADWCGQLVQKYEPKVTWTMCNGLTANNTIHTCNSIDTGDQWLEAFGGNGRIQVDQPPIFTEFEEGFQDWGETPEKPSDYFYGRTARDSTRHALRWFARGGTHLNYYMFFGAYNRASQAAGGITNFYATEAALCPSGQRHEPKFSHYSSLHDVLSDIAPTLLAAPTALNKSKKVKILDKHGNWIDGNKQRYFEYKVAEQKETESKHVLFVENDAHEKVDVRLPFNHPELARLSLSPASAVLIVDGIVEFDSATIASQFMSWKRVFEGVTLLDWSSWPEQIGATGDERLAQTSSFPIEQTQLNVDSSISSQYAWYETTFHLDKPIQDVQVSFDSQRSNGLLVYIDGGLVDDVEDHSHLYEGNYSMTANVGDVSNGFHKLSILSESFGYSNLIGRFGNSKTGPKLKGITGDVILWSKVGTKNISLVDGREWISFPGLHGTDRVEPLQEANQNVATPTWFSTIFESPTFDATRQALFLEVKTGRGHAWLNGRDLGRFWNITRGNTSQLSQQYYLLPADFLRADSLNTVTIFDLYGSDHPDNTRLVLSSVVPSGIPNFRDEVSYPMACL